MKRFAFYLAFGLALSSLAQATETGSICGTVLDENGQPANNILIAAIYLGAQAHTGPYPSSRSNALGHYCIVNVPYGDNVPAADDPKHGYPNTQFTFYAQRTSNKEQPNIAHLSGDHPRATIDLCIPYKAAIVTVRLTDAVTGKSLEAMSYRLSAQADPRGRHMFGTQSSADALLLPPNENILLQVGALGYRQWPYDDSPGFLINLLPGERTAIDIALQPK